MLGRGDSLAGCKSCIFVSSKCSQVELGQTLCEFGHGQINIYWVLCVSVKEGFGRVAWYFRVEKCEVRL